MNRIVIVLITMMTFLLSCKGCLSHIYAVHEEIEYLDLIYTDTSISTSALLNYFDSALKFDTANYEIRDSLDGVKLSEEQRIVCFKKDPNESYRVAVNGYPCWIMGVFNERIDKFHWVYSKDKIKDEELKRIEKRFKDEILSKVNKHASD